MTAYVRMPCPRLPLEADDAARLVDLRSGRSEADVGELTHVQVAAVDLDRERPVDGDGGGPLAVRELRDLPAEELGGVEVPSEATATFVAPSSPLATVVRAPVEALTLKTLPRAPRAGLLGPPGRIDTLRAPFWSSSTSVGTGSKAYVTPTRQSKASAGAPNSAARASTIGWVSVTGCGGSTATVDTCPVRST